MPTKIQLKRGLDANVAAATLLAGEPAFVLDTGKLYIGNGTDKALINPIDKPAGLNTTNTYTKIKVNEYGQVVLLDNLIATDIPAISYTQVTGLGTAATLNSGTSAGNLPVLDGGGKLPVSTLPAIAITDTFVVASEAEMLALDAQPGDVAVRSDILRSFILKAAPASTLENWVELETPTDSVLSVNGQTGVVVLTASNIDMTGYTKASSYIPIVAADTVSSAVGKLEKYFDTFAPLDSPSFTGTPTSTTPATADNTTKIATTAYVKENLTSYATLVSPSFTGTPTSTTASLGDNTNTIATTAFVQAATAITDGGTF
ncbi:hypothetical protein V6615_06395 [Oscillospiraceae bacterium PP1C4]